MELANKVAVVTAGGSGIGRATSLLFAEEGAAVAVVDINGEAAAGTVAAIEAAGGSGSSHAVDCSDSAALKVLFDELGERYARLDVLFNHAGIPNPHGIAEIEDADFDRAVGVNLRSGFFATRYALPLFRRSGEGGAIVFTASSTRSPRCSPTRGSASTPSAPGRCGRRCCPASWAKARRRPIGSPSTTAPTTR
jgi:NAD(P)-dependent dehydrogenase (short-subunit alcohol dehydrogenase family)